MEINMGEIIIFLHRYNISHQVKMMARLSNSPYVYLFNHFLLVIKLIFIGVMLAASFISSSQAIENPEEETIYMQLRWHHQFQFAGYYAALEKGFYKQEGLNVTLRSGSPARQPIDEVLSGKAQYAQGNSEVLFYRLQGKPLVALAAIFQHSPSALLTLKSSGIRSVHDLVGKKVMLANSHKGADFLTMLVNEKISPSQLQIMPSSYQLEDLINGNTDAFNAYTTNEPFLLKQKNIPFNIIEPVSYRVDFYSDILFTSEEELNDNPRRVAAMLRASLKGWRYAMDNPEEIIDLLITKYQVNKSREHLRFEAAEIRKLILPNLINIGHMNPKRWQHMADAFIKANLIDDKKNIDGFIYDSFSHKLPKWVSIILFSALILIIFFSSISFYLHRFNCHLEKAKKTLQLSEERFKAFTETASGGIAIYTGGEILECNHGLSEITGFSYQELTSMNGLKLIDVKDVNTVLENISRDYPDKYEITGLRKNKSKYPLALKGKNIIYNGRKAHVIEFIDITKSKKIEEQLKLAASVFTHAREGIMITDLNGIILEVNDTFNYITGYRREEVLNKNSRILKSEKHDEAFYASMWESLINKKEWSGELWNKRKNGEVFPGLMTISAISDSLGNTQNYVVLFSDITKMKQHEQQLEHLAHYDLLTNLPNRMLLAERLSKAMAETEQKNEFIAVAYLDLDAFKNVNDTLGHDVGDQLLIKLSKLMSKVLRENDTLARIGGDEFVVVLTDLEKMGDCELVLKRLLETVAKTNNVGNQQVQISTSIGVTFYPSDGVEADQLMRHADQAMYTAKQMGKNRYHFFDIHENKSMQSKHEVIEDIKRGIEQNEFILYYQPKVNMRTGAIIGAEALIRWQHSERGLLLPGEFLSIIENQKISLRLGEWVIDTALAQMVKWQSEGFDIPVSVNVDAFQLQQIDFVEKLAAAIEQRLMPSTSHLQLEILETSALGEMADVLKTMQACLDLGVSFSLDDFGTGFSSLTYLKKLPAELLKIDQSFVRDMLVDPEDRSIVMGVIGLALAFNRQVIAEGVESIEHGTQLLSMGCELAQGYGIARPMPPENIVPWIADWTPDIAWTH